MITTPRARPATADEQVRNDDLMRVIIVAAGCMFLVALGFALWAIYGTIPAEWVGR